MNRPSRRIKLLESASQQLVDATLYEGIADNNRADFVKDWIPLLKQALKNRELVQDSHWRWPEKSIAYEDSLEYVLCAIECMNSTQGMMMLKLIGYQSRLEKGKDLVYVHLISVAPWNRPILGASPRYKLVGSNFIAEAVAKSVEVGLDGRIGLHSLSGASDFYRSKLNMTSFGHDSSYQNLEYFEMSKGEANAFYEDMRK